MLKKALILSLLPLSFLSLSAQAIKPNQYYLVANDYITPNLVKEHENALADFKTKAVQAGYESSWIFYSFDDGRHTAFSPRTGHDYEAEEAKRWQKVETKFSPEFLEKNNEVYKYSIQQQDLYLVKHLDTISYEQHSNTHSPYLVWLEIDLKHDAWDKVKPSLVEWTKEMKSSNSEFSFSTYSKQYGTNLPTIFIAFHANSLVEFYQKLEKKGLHDPFRLLPKASYSGVNQYRVSHAKLIPEISY